MKSGGEQNVGIWLDGHKAKLIVIHQDHIHLLEVKSEVEDYHPHGGYGSSSKYLAQDAVKEKSLTERKKHQMTSYFKDICGSLPEGMSGLYLMGPGETKKAFHKYLSNSHGIQEGQVKVEPADKMTNNQFKAKVMSYFNEG